MKLEVREDYGITLKEVFAGLCLETEEGNRLGVCMRDDTFELQVQPKGGGVTQFRIDMQNGIIGEMILAKSFDPEPVHDNTQIASAVDSALVTSTICNTTEGE